MDILKIVLFSLIPALIYALIIYFTVPYKTIKLKTSLFYLFGGFLSVGLLFLFFEYVPSWNQLALNYSNPLLYPLEFFHIRNFIQVGFIEELFKLVCFFIIDYYRRRKGDTNDHPLAIMFYVCMVSLGFAIVENFFYGIRQVDMLNQIVIENSLSVLRWRTITSVLGHMTFGLFMGYWISLGRLKVRLYNRSIFDIVILKRDKIKRILFTLIGLLSATILHGIYDLHLTLNNQQGISTLYIFILMLFLGAFWCFKRLSNSNK